MHKAFILPLIVIAFLGSPCVSYSKNNPIAFSSDRSGDFEIYTMATDGSNPKRLTYRPGDDIHPVWSPDGEKIIFASDYQGDFDIWSMQSDGTDLQLLTIDMANDKAPAISAQGDRIAFHSYRDGNWEIYVMNIDGSSKQNITNSALTETYPFWAPNDKFLVYHAKLDSGNWEIFKRQADGLSPVNLSNHDATDTLPSISPDGKHIAFWSNRSGEWRIYRMSIDGNELSLITTTAPDPQKFSKAAWSPDSRTLLFPQSHDIYSIGTDGTDLTNLTKTTGIDIEPSWFGKKFPWPAFLPAFVGGRKGLSPAQNLFVQSAGYPQQFIKIFGKDTSGTQRVDETWNYVNLGVVESFINGEFEEEKELGVTDSTLAPSAHHPEDYHRHSTEDNIIAKHGHPLAIQEELVWDGTVRNYIYSTILFGFHNGRLTSVISTK